MTEDEEIERLLRQEASRVRQAGRQLLDPHALVQRAVAEEHRQPRRSRSIWRTAGEFSAVAALIVVIAATYLVIHRGGNDHPVAQPGATSATTSAHLSTAPASGLPTSDGTNCGSSMVQAEVSGRPPVGLLTCSGLAMNATPRVLSVSVGQTVSIAGLPLMDRNGLLVTDTPTTVSVDNAQHRLKALAAGRALVQLRSKLLCPQEGNLCSLVILDIS